MLPGILLGALGTYLYLRHRKRGVDHCSKCARAEEVGVRIKYIPVGVMNTPMPFCKKCRPELFGAE